MMSCAAKPRRSRMPVLAGPLALLLLLSACGNAVPASAPSIGSAGSLGTAASSTAAPSTGASSENASMATEGTAAPTRITPEDAKTRLDTGEAIVLVDVRTAEEHAEARIPGSLLLPVDEIGQRAPEALPDKSATLFVYCRSGRRSAIAADELSALGYTSVFDLGGIIDWPYETESGPVGNP